jgi:hypothetical protein
VTAARVGPVGGTGRGWGTRGVRPRSLDKAWLWVRARVYPRGRQVGQGSHLGVDTRLASGGGKRERFGEDLCKILACTARAPFPLSFFQIFQMLSMLGLFLWWS